VSVVEMAAISLTRLASPARHFLLATPRLAQSASLSNVGLEGVPPVRALVIALHCGQTPLHPRERGISTRSALDYSR